MDRSTSFAWLTAAVLGVVAVVLLVVLLAGGDDQVGSSGESSAVAACDVLAGLPDELDVDDEGAMTEFTARMGSVASLAMLAAAQDDAYDELAEAVERMRGVYAAEFSIEVSEFAQAREHAEDLCSGLG